MSFYVSGIKNRSNYYITDTEDGVTELLSCDDVWKLLKAGYQVDGISWERRTHQGKTSIFINARVVTSDVNKASVAKLKFAHGIDIALAPDGGLARFGFISKVMQDKDKHVVRLSDYCNGVHSCGFGGIASFDFIRDVTIIFDDKIEYFETGFLKNMYITSHTGREVRMKWDITEFTDKKLRATLMERLVGIHSMVLIKDSNAEKDDVFYYQLVEFLDFKDCIYGDSEGVLRQFYGSYMKDTFDFLADNIVAMYFKRNGRSIMNTLKDHMHGTPTCRYSYDWYMEKRGNTLFFDDNVKNVKTILNGTVAFLNQNNVESAQSTFVNSIHHLVSLPFHNGNKGLKACAILWSINRLPEPYKSTFEQFIENYYYFIREYLKNDSYGSKGIKQWRV